MKKNWKRRIINGLVVIVVVVGLALLAHALTANFNFIELIKGMHGG